LGTETHLGANWGSQTYTHRIREERECATCQHLFGPPRRVSATCQHLIGPPQLGGSHHYADMTSGSHQHATWQALTDPPQHQHATWKHCSNTPQHPSATWQLVIGVTSQWTKTHGIRCFMPP
jgi:hypothetical protein